MVRDNVGRLVLLFSLLGFYGLYCFMIDRLVIQSLLGVALGMLLFEAAIIPVFNSAFIRLRDWRKGRGF